MENNEQIYLVQPRDFTFGETPEDALELSCGSKLRNVNLRYECAGTLNEDRSNAILILHALTGDAHVCGRHTPEDRKPGWWDEMIGPGKYVDTNRYFIVCSNVIGGCSGSTGPQSINPDTGKPYNLDFPVVTISDMVRAQKRLADHLGITRWLSVIGGSMGGMQALEWAISYPEMVQSVIPIATTAQISPQSIAFDWVGREAIKNDPNWNNGEEIPERPPLNERIDVAMKQFALNLDDKGEHIACLEARKHLAWYLRGVSHSGYYKEKISHLSTAQEVESVAKAIKRDLR